MGEKGKHLIIKKTAICEQRSLGRVSFRQKTITERSSKGNKFDQKYFRSRGHHKGMERHVQKPNTANC